MATKFDASQIAAQILAGVDIDKIVTEAADAASLQAQQAKPGSGEKAGSLTPPASKKSDTAEQAGHLTGNNIGTKTESSLPETKKDGEKDHKDDETTNKDVSPVNENAVEPKPIWGEGAGKNDDGSTKEPVTEAEEKKELEDSEDDKKADKEMWDKVNKKVTESFSRIFTGSDLSDSFKDEMKTLFVATVTEAATHYKGVFQVKAKNNAKKLAAAAVKSVTEAVEKRADAYLQHTVTEWAKANSTALKTNARVTVMESLMADMIKVFASHNISLVNGANATPITKALAVSVTESANLADDAIKTQFKLKQENEALKRELIVLSESKKLTEVQTANLRTITESAEYKDEASFRKSVCLIRDRLVNTAQTASSTGVSSTLQMVTESVQTPATQTKPATNPSNEDIQKAMLKLGTGSNY